MSEELVEIAEDGRITPVRKPKAVPNTKLKDLPWDCILYSNHYQIMTEQKEIWQRWERSMERKWKKLEAKIAELEA